MRKLHIMLLGLASVGVGLFAGPGMAAPVHTSLAGKTVVLVHGAWADGSSWSKVIPLLEARGLTVIAVQNPLSSLEDDVAATRRAMERASGPVILVGHSWGGAVISEAGNDAKVKALVYVAALAPDKGESANDLSKGAPPAPWTKLLHADSAGFLTLPTTAVQQYFAQDLPAAESKLVAAIQGPWAARCLSDVLTVAAWHDKPSWTVVPTNDQIIPPAAQDEMAARIHAHVVHVNNSSHVVMISHPRAVADTIIAAAEATS